MTTKVLPRCSAGDSAAAGADQPVAPAHQERSHLFLGGTAAQQQHLLLGCHQFVGRDLQFIRINGTIVGGLAGLVIYTLGRLL